MNLVSGWPSYKSGRSRRQISHIAQRPLSHIREILPGVMAHLLTRLARREDSAALAGRSQ
jgi:hypothetical protein